MVSSLKISTHHESCISRKIEIFELVKKKKKKEPETATESQVVEMLTQWLVVPYLGSWHAS